MRILFGISSFEVGGTELHALKAMKALRAAGHEVAVIVARPIGDIAPQFTEHFPVFTYNLRSLISPSYLTANKEIYNALRSWKPDVVHALDKYGNAMLLPIARVLGIKRVIGSKRWFMYQPSQYRYINGVAYQFAHRVAANGEAIRQTLIDTDWVPKRKAEVLWNIVDDAMFERPSEDWLNQHREEFAIPSGASVIGMVARVSKVKDHPTFLRALATVHTQMPNAVAVVVGDGPELPSLRALAVELGIADAVRFVGYRPNLPNVNWLFDIAVLTSTSEGSPNSILEAMASGCPVVASEVGGLRDITAFGPPAALVPPGDDAGFAREMVAFLRKTPDSLDVRFERSQLIKQRFSPAQFVRASEALYKW
jgi:glycosyltransferase involved in cell wall biosynthesis